MGEQARSVAASKAASNAAEGMLQRKCVCGNHTAAGATCSTCAQGGNALQRKLAVGASDDAFEREADRVADAVLATSTHTPVASAAQRIQRLTTQTCESSQTAPVSVERALSARGMPLDPPLRHDMEKRFGQDFSHVRIHTDGAAQGSARDVSARAYTVGHDIVFGAGSFAPRSQEGRRLLAHELTHVVQQSGRQGVGSVARQVQRFAFVNEGQVHQRDPNLTTDMKAMVTDGKVRNYNDLDEFKKHAGKRTDYLGNLKDGTWVRFSPTGINLLGEYHTEVTLEEVVPAVGSKSFIYEPLTSDALKEGSAFATAYLTENRERFRTFGVDQEKDKQQFGAESLSPKMGYNMMNLLPFLEGKFPLSGLKRAGYFGQPAQRYLKIAWGYSKDNMADVLAKKTAKVFVPPKIAALAAVHAKVEAQLDSFITSLVVNGFLGDELEKPGKAVLLAPLAEFARAFTEAMMRVAASDRSSRLSDSERIGLAGSTPSTDAAKSKLFTEWRDFKFEDNVAAATKRGVRYAGMGQAHLDHLVSVGLKANQFSFEMNGQDIVAFKALTDRLKKAARRP